MGGKWTDWEKALNGTESEDETSQTDVITQLHSHSQGFEFNCSWCIVGRAMLQLSLDRGGWESSHSESLCEWRDVVLSDRGQIQEFKPQSVNLGSRETSGPVAWTEEALIVPFCLTHTFCDLPFTAALQNDAWQHINTGEMHICSNVILFMFFNVL